MKPENYFLALPVVIHSIAGEFLGMPSIPGQPFTLNELITLLIKGKNKITLKRWSQENEDWIFSFKSLDGPLHELFFHKTKTPKGNIVSLFNKLYIDSQLQEQQFLVSFFRKIRDFSGIH